jgi:multidrug efflux pump subunit AcrB
VELWGVQEKVIYIDVTEQQLAERGLTAENFIETLGTENMVVDAGYIDVQTERLRGCPHRGVPLPRGNRRALPASPPTKAGQ